MRISKYTPVFALALSAFLIAGAGCTGTTTTTDKSNADTTVTVNKNPEGVTDTLVLGNDNANKAVVEVEVEDADVNSDSTDASITIVDPVNGDTVPPSFDIVVGVDGFTLTPDKVEGDNVVGEGHFHIWIDGEYYAPGVSQITAIKDLTVGEHELMVSLQNNDHTDLVNPVKSESITVTVETAQ